MVAFSNWPFAALDRLRQLLRDEKQDKAIVTELARIEEELARKRAVGLADDVPDRGNVAVRGIWNRDIDKDVIFGMYATDDEANDAAKKMKLPIDGPTDVGGKPFRVIIDPPAKISMSVD